MKITKWAIYCVDPEEECTGYVGCEDNYSSVEAMYRAEGSDAFFNSVESAENAIESDPCLMEHAAEDGFKYCVKYAPIDMGEEIKTSIRDMIDVAPFGELVEGVMEEFSISRDVALQYIAEVASERA